MAAATRPWTRAELARLPDDGNRYEVLDGVLLMTPQPSARHQRVALNLAIALHAYCREHRTGFVVGPGAIPRGKSELQPDVLVIPDATIPFDADWADLPTPALVVEVLSSSTRARDLGIKRAAYLRWGIPEYQIVDVERRHVIVVRAGAPDEQVTEVLRWRPQSKLSALEIPLDEIFR